MRIVLFGKNGQVGWEFQRTLPMLGDVIALGRAELDVSDLQAVERGLREWRPHLIINATAYTEVDQAEKEADLAMTINAEAPGVMAEVARDLNAVLIHYSTDYVFDGTKGMPYTESDVPNPLSVYGLSKRKGEEHIEQAGDAYLILRTSWVYSLRGNSFVNKVLKWSRQNTTLKVVSDQVSNPTWARALADVTALLLAKSGMDLYSYLHERRGIYHLAGRGFTSRYEWAKHILACDPNPSEQLTRSLQPASSEEFPTPAHRPLFSALDCSHFESTFGLRLPAWDETLRLAMLESAARNNQG
jgi:dTDP-4-dehydrorhamnose reductase